MNNNKLLKDKTVVGLFWSFSDLIAKQLIQFIIQIFLARLLVPEDFGIIGIITVFIAISQLFIDSGFSSALIREKNVTQEDYSTIFYFNFIISILIYIFLFITAPFISSFFNEIKLIKILRILGLVLIVNSIGLIQRTILLKKINFKIQTKISVFASILSGIFAILFAYFGFGVWSLVVKLLVMQLTQSILLCTYNKWKPSFVFCNKSFIKFFNFSWKLLISGLINTIYNNLYYIIIGKLFSTIDLGYYTNAQKFRDIASQSLSNSIQKVSYPVFCNLNDESKSLRNAYKKIIKMSVYIIFPVMIGLASIAEPLFNLLFGIKWVNSIQYFQILCLSGMLYPLHAINLNILQVKGRSDLFLRLEIIKKIIGVVSIFVVLFFKLGIIGLTWALVINSYIAFFINSFYSAKLLDYSTMQQIKDIFLSFIISIFMGIFVLFVQNFIHYEDFIKLLVGTICGVGFYSIFSIIFLREELVSIYKIINSFLKKN